MNPLARDVKALTRSIPKNQVIATVTPKGPRLNLQPVHDRVIITDPDAEQPDPLDSALILPNGGSVGARLRPFAKVRVVAVGPMAQSVKVGDEIIVRKAEARDPVVYDGNIYHWINESAIQGIVVP